LATSERRLTREGGGRMEPTEGEQKPNRDEHGRPAYARALCAKEVEPRDVMLVLA
jgi:hypothetical protein